MKPFARYTWKFFNSDVSGSLSVHLIPLRLNSHGIFQVITSTWESHLICSFLLLLNGGGSWPSLRRKSKFNATLIFLLQENLCLLTGNKQLNTFTFPLSCPILKQLTNGLNASSKAFFGASRVRQKGFQW